MSRAGDSPAGGSSKAVARRPRLSREAGVALVLLPGLLGAGFVLGGRLLHEDPPAVDAAGATVSDQTSAEPVQPPAEPAQPPAEPAQPPAEPVAAPPPVPQQPGAAPALTGPATVFGIGQVSEDIRRWQQRMAERGWDIVADGVYGPQTARVAARFQAEAGLAVDGVVGPDTWAAAWEAPVA